MSGAAEARSAIALLDEAARLDREAREHKRREQFHRRKARDARQAISDIRAQCERLGIGFVIHHGQSPKEDIDR